MLDGNINGWKYKLSVFIIGYYCLLAGDGFIIVNNCLS